MGNKTELSIYDLFYGDGKLKRAPNLTDDFLRPVYQYTHQEIKNHQREKMLMDAEEDSKHGEINY